MTIKIQIHGNVNQVNNAEKLEQKNYFCEINTGQEVVCKINKLLSVIDNSNMSKEDKQEVMENLRSLSDEAKKEYPDKSNAKSCIETIGKIISIGGNIERIHHLWIIIRDSEWIQKMLT